MNFLTGLASAYILELLPPCTYKSKLESCSISNSGLKSDTKLQRQMVDSVSSIVFQLQLRHIPAKLFFPVNVFPEIDFDCSVCLLLACNFVVGGCAES